MNEFDMVIHYSPISEGFYTCHEVSELIHCKDCKNFVEMMTAKYHDGITKEVQYCKKYVPLKDENFYCGWAERKEKEE